MNKNEMKLKEQRLFILSGFFIMSLKYAFKENENAKIAYKYYCSRDGQGWK
jgi:hypothetical protein